ncbi:MAG TPA: class I SAM-dependent methyltransferase [Chthoniobacterales bacterium]|jgi:2-polyprenyl-3-methyl-5-hydroxy-6-metoxy-1,4-benzoquinol methylase
MSNIVQQKHWDEAYDAYDLKFVPENVPFKELFDAYLPSGGSCFEVGAYPGNILAYLCSRFGYTANGIDLTPHVQNRLAEFFTRQGIKIGDFFYGDFLQADLNQTYDVVCSFGFIEHFTNFDEVIQKHVELVKPGGVLILSCPNFRRLQYLIHRALDNDNLRRHVLSAMDFKAWKEVLEKNGMEVLSQDYWRTIGFWHENRHPNKLQRAGIRIAQRLATAIDLRTDLPNRFTSPHMVTFARKPDCAVHQAANVSEAPGTNQISAVSIA